VKRRTSTKISKIDSQIAKRLNKLRLVVKSNALQENHILVDVITVAKELRT
jgi:hypothetical protein